MSKRQGRLTLTLAPTSNRVQSTTTNRSIEKGIIVFASIGWTGANVLIGEVYARLATIRDSVVPNIITSVLASGYLTLLETPSWVGQYIVEPGEVVALSAWTSEAAITLYANIHFVIEE